ncbi:hypothetical protein [Neorhodopirellula lusitana]|uniref:hypothetical protein n=1 Tax=Neorhodopirellula lusitana TaxID=445327 RepID=UPI00384B5E1B
MARTKTNRHAEDVGRIINVGLTINNGGGYVDYERMQRDDYPVDRSAQIGQGEDLNAFIERRSREMAAADEPLVAPKLDFAPHASKRPVENNGVTVNSRNPGVWNGRGQEPLFSPTLDFSQGESIDDNGEHDGSRDYVWNNRGQEPLVAPKARF